MNWFLNRLLEPSSHVGMGLATYGINGLVNGNVSVATIGATLFGLLGIVVPEAGAVESVVLSAPAAPSNSNGAGSGQ